jgi:hypothetical protein
MNPWLEGVCRVLGVVTQAEKQRRQHEHNEVMTQVCGILDQDPKAFEGCDVTFHYTDEISHASRYRVGPTPPPTYIRREGRITIQDLAQRFAVGDPPPYGLKVHGATPIIQKFLVQYQEQHPKLIKDEPSLSMGMGQ